MKKYLVLRNVPMENWTLDECDTWEEAEKKFYELLRYGGGEVIITEHIPIKIVPVKND